MTKEQILYVLEHFAGDAEKLKERLLSSINRAIIMNRPRHKQALVRDLETLNVIIAERQQK